MLNKIIYIVEKKTGHKRYSIKHPENNELRTCPACSSNFCILKNRKRIFCSDVCRKSYPRNYKKGKDHFFFGKSYEERFGVEKAQALKKHLSDIGKLRNSKREKKDLRYCVCVGCGVSFVMFDKKQKYCSRICYTQHYVYSMDTRLKMSASGKERIFTDAHKNNLSINCKGKNKGKVPWNKDLTVMTDERIRDYGKKVSKAKKGILHTEEQNKKITIGLLKAYCRDDVRENYKKSMKSRGIKRFPYNGALYRSTWEVKFAKRLDMLGIEFEYELQSFKLFDGEHYYNYLPDFFLPKFNLFIEIKGFYDEKVLKKLALFSEQYNLMMVDNLWKISVFDINAYF